MPLPYKNTPDETEHTKTEEALGHTLTIHSSMTFDQSPLEVYQHLTHVSTIVNALPELRTLRLVNGETYLWKIEFGRDFFLEGEMKFTQRSEGDIVLWQTTEGSPTQVSGSVRFHSADEPQESPTGAPSGARVAMTTHVRVPSTLQLKIGAENIRERLIVALNEALLRVRNGLDAAKASPAGLRRETLSELCNLKQNSKKDSPLR